MTELLFSLPSRLEWLKSVQNEILTCVLLAGELCFSTCSIQVHLHHFLLQDNKTSMYSAMFNVSSAPEAHDALGNDWTVSPQSEDDVSAD